MDRSQVRDSCYLPSPLEWWSTLRPFHLSPRFWTCPSLLLQSTFLGGKYQANYFTLRCDCLITSQIPFPGMVSLGIHV